MKRNIFWRISAVALIAAATVSEAATWYVNDASRTGDVYCSAAGNDANAGTSGAAPFLTLAKAMAQVAPGDTVYVDTGTYAEQLTVPVAGTAEQWIRVIGSTNGTYVRPKSGAALFLQKGYYEFENLKACGAQGMWAHGSAAGHYVLRNCALESTSTYALWLNMTPGDVQLENCSLTAKANSVQELGRQTGNRAVHCVFRGPLLLQTSDAWSFHEDIFQTAGAAFEQTSAFVKAIPDDVRNSLFHVGRMHAGTAEVPNGYALLEDLEADYPGWKGNLSGDPCFVDAGGRDYHLQSPYGYVKEQTNSAGIVTGRSWVTNAEAAYSPAIDLGVAGVAGEPEPNGGRMNAGMYGGTWAASKSATNAFLRALTYNQGGQAVGGTKLEWVAVNFAAGAKVNVQISTNGGGKWTKLATVAATNGSYSWTVAAGQESPNMRWRVASADDGNVYGMNGKAFSARTSPATHFDFYVNDGSREGDVYCNAIGQPGNDGLSTGTPKASLQELLETYGLAGGDTVYVDTGTYEEESPLLEMRHSGRSAEDRVKILGSERGSVFDVRNTTKNGVTVSRARWVELSHLTVTGGGVGFSVTNGAVGIGVKYGTFRGNKTGLSVFGTDVTAEHCVIAGNSDRGVYSSGVALDHCTVYGNKVGIAGTTNVTLRNSVLGGSSQAAFANYSGSGAQIAQGDYNVLWGNAAYHTSVTTLQELQKLGLGWEHSFVADPLFADAEGGDYHLKSETGRYDAGTGAYVADGETSSAIDAGDPAGDYAQEPAPNGGRVNIGAYGGTAQASKSRTNAWLQVETFNDGGALDAQTGETLRWHGGGYGAGATATIWLSRNDGLTWEELATGVDAASGAYFYQNTDTNDASALYARWKITLDGASGAGSESLTNFAYKNGAYHFYVNDENLEGDVYCTAPGDDANAGISRDTPMRTLSKLLNKYTLGAGDCVYIDTGTYSESATIAFGSGDIGEEGKPLRLIGSTNRAAGGTQFGNQWTRLPRTCMSFGTGAAHITLENLIFTNMVAGIQITRAEGITLENVDMRGVGTGVGISGNSRRVTVKHSAFHGGNESLTVDTATEITVKNNAFVDPAEHAVRYGGTGSSLTLRNNAFTGHGAGALLGYSTTAGLDADYNGWDGAGNMLVGENTATGERAENLYELQQQTGLETHGVPGDPGMADAGGFDCHLKTAQTLGRHTDEGWTSDVESSRLLDAGDPADGTGEEPEHNGGRINIGRYGGTREASKSPDTPWVQALSFADGGSVKDGAIPLRWVAGGGMTEDVKVEVTRDGGRNWQTVASQVGVTNGETTWNLSGLADTPAAMWRVTGRTTKTAATNGVFFGIRNAPLELYVATVDTNEAVYVTGPGAADHYEATRAAPMDNLQHLVDLFDLEGGDTVYVDRGTYESGDTLTVGAKDSGTEANPVVFVGDRSDPYRGSVLKQSLRRSGTYLLDVTGARNVRFEALGFSNAWTVVDAGACSGVEFRQSLLGYAVTNTLNLRSGADCTVRSSILAGSLANAVNAWTGSVARVENSYVKDNAYGFRLSGGSVTVENSILKASGLGHSVYAVLSAAGGLESDYNDILVENSAGVGSGNGGNARFLIDWQKQREYRNDKHSFGSDPGFYAEGAGDYHLLSANGRYSREAEGFERDATSSALIDMGNPGSAYANETSPNGGRINIGLYGNTSEASRSGATGSIVPLTMSDGGTIRGEAKLYWSYNGFAENEHVNLLFSDNGGESWDYVIATNVYINADGQTWVTTNYPSTAMGAWKIELASNPEISGETTSLFAIKNDPVKYYVNDGSTEGDVYCTAAGRSGNNGLAPETPMNSLEALLGRYKVEAGDTVYVDTGTYRQSGTLAISISTPDATAPLLIQGSTNEMYGGSVFTNSAGGVLWRVQDSHLLEIRDIRLAGGQRGLEVVRSASNVFYHVRSEGARESGYYLGERADQNRFVQCAALNAFQTGLFLYKPTDPKIAVATNTWEGGVMTSAGQTAEGANVSTGRLVGVQGGRLYVSNSVFVARQPTFDVYDTVSGGVLGDYNLYSLPHDGSALVREKTGATYGVVTRKYRTLSSWSEWAGCDEHSLAGDPLFADLEGGDLHPKSEGGRYNALRGEWVKDAETSPLIDTGDPAAAYGREGEPNGGRLDLGYYGNHEQASHAPTNQARYVLQTLNVGGVARGDVELKWIPQGIATNAGQRVNVQLSTNSGGSWIVLAQNVDSRSGAYMWTNSAAQRSCPTMRWRLVCPTNLVWNRMSEADFILHNDPLKYYLNDHSPEKDVYCTAPGSAANDGQSPATPMDSLADLLTRYDLEPGDTVYMDTGDYVQTAVAKWEYMDAGTAEEPVTLQGSTNTSALERTRLLGAGLRLDNVSGVVVRDILVDEPTVQADAVTVASSSDVELERVDVAASMAHGIWVQRTSNAVVRNFSVKQAHSNGVALHAPYGVRLESGVVISNTACVDVWRLPEAGGTASLYANSYATVVNCSLSAAGYRQPVYTIRATLHADYNNYELKDGALVGISTLTAYSKEYDSVGNWTQETGQDAHTLSVEPKYKDARNGDFHLLTGSELIDAGDPASAYEREPNPNGDRINIGRYGNTADAAKSPKGSSITLVSYSDGGKASGTNALITWVYRGTNEGERLNIFYSADAGKTWTALAEGVDPKQGNWMWNTELSASSVQAQLKLETTGGAVSQSHGVFSARNEPFSFYVNDSSRKGDVYCTAAGKATNDGLTPGTPMTDLNRLLEKYDLEAGDTVYVDTGVYDSGLTPWRITQSDSAGISESGGVNEPPVTIQGSTNSLLNGTVLNRNGQPVGIQVDNAAGVLLRNLTVTNTSEKAVHVNTSYGVTLEWMAANVADVGFSLYGGSGLKLRNSIALNSQRGILVSGRDRAMTNHVAPVVENNLVWGAELNGVELGAMNAMELRNNLLSVKPGGYVYQVGFRGELEADYNGVYLTDGARMYAETLDPEVYPLPLVYETLGAWAAESGKDQHSYDGDPQFADEAGNDYHLKSAAGRWTGSKWVKDATSSPLLDAGAPESDWSREPSPNGGRVNIGLYGGTAEASKTPTSASVRLLTLNRGGVASGLVSFNWLATGLPAGTQFDLELSMDGGATWTTKGSGLDAGLGGVKMNTAAWGASPRCLWRLSSGGSAWATSEEPFVLHNGGIPYYVNDGSTEGDVYCTAAGSSENDGCSPARPARWVHEILDRYNLEPGDTVYVDTGDYHVKEPVVWGDLDSGSMDQRTETHVRLQGSTNEVYGGTRFLYADEDATGIVLTNVYGVTLSHLTQIGGSEPLKILNSYYSGAEWLTIQGASNGVTLNTSSNVSLSHCVLKGNQNGLKVRGMKSGDIDVSHTVAWSNRHAFHLDAGWITLTNSIVGSFGSDTYAYYIQTDGRGYVQGDYNNLYQQGGGKVAGYQSGSGVSSRTSTYASVSAWYDKSGNDAHSLGHDPKLADPGAGDYHLKSAGGRIKYNSDGTKRITYDAGSSALIDAGNPGDLRWANEPSPNGRRLNIGLYGGTAEASRTAMSGWITVLSLNDGGTAAGDIDLQWTAGGVATNYSVCLEYSPDRGKTWQEIACGVPAADGHYLWNSVDYGRSALGMWRVYCVENASILAESQTPFVLRNGGSIYYFVNDGSTEGDVYCTAAGDDTADGLTAETPKASIQAILDEYELAPSDVILVDAGTYAIQKPIEIGMEDSGYTNAAGDRFYVTIRGSTNPAAATLLTSPSLGMESIIHLNYAECVRLSDMTLRHALTGVKMKNALCCRLENLRIQECNNSGLLANNFSQGNEAVNSVFWKNTSRTGGVAVAISASSDVGFRNCVLWGSDTSVKLSASSIRMTNSVAFASGSGGRVYNLDMASGIQNVQADYNCYYCTNSSLTVEKALLTGGSEYYNLLPSWQTASGNDRHSMQCSPQFVKANDGDFHLSSPYGTYPEYTVDMTRPKSLLLDAGNSADSCENEPLPNGGVVNVGAYGNTEQESLSDTNKWLQAISYNEGGTMTADVLLYWTYGGMPGGTKVNLSYTLNEGWTWVTIATNVEVGSRGYEWDVSAMPLCLTLQWKIEVAEDTEIYDVSDNYIVVKTQNYDYYVNDGSRDGDVYCTAAGNDDNDGLSPATPKEHLWALLSSYPVGAGDRVFIDTGVYELDEPVTLGAEQSGTAEFPLRVYGSTNWAKGGSLFTGVDQSHAGLRMQNARYLELNHLRFTQMSNAVYLLNADKIKLSGVEAFGNLDAGIRCLSCGQVDSDHLLLTGNRGYGYISQGQMAAGRLENCTIAGNTSGCVSLQQNALTVVNSILSQDNDEPIYWLTTQAAKISGDHNLFVPRGGGSIAQNQLLKADYTVLKQWQDECGEWNSWVGDALFVDEAGGDYHLQSRAGYWNGGTWKTSAGTSWAIDAGDPELGTGEEPTPNGQRLNLGRYGGTAQASKSDASRGELLAISLRDGGIEAYGDVLSWLSRGLAATNEVLIQYAPDGETWITVDRVAVGSSPYEWRSTDDPSPEALWRVVLVGDESVKSETETPFIFRPSPLRYYVNDGTLSGDVYCTAAGSPENCGYRPNSPLDSLTAVLDRYSLTGGDTIYVDTGTYELEHEVELTSVHSGTAEQPVQITGSTNAAAGGTLVRHREGQTNAAITLTAASNIRLSNLRLQGFTNGVSFGQYTANCTLEDSEVKDSYGTGIGVMQAQGVLLKHVAIRNGALNGVQLSNGRLTMDGCVVWGNGASAIYMGGGSTLNMTNSVLEARGFGNYCYESDTNITLKSDYNDLYLRDNAQLGSIEGKQYEKLPQWVKGMKQDVRSLSTDPLFADADGGDFHARSAAGRYRPGTGWVKDAHEDGVEDYSPLIDMGSPLYEVGEEPAPNGGRANIGLYGGTWQASKSNTNAWLQAVTAMSGGLTYGTFYLIWGWGGDMDANTDAMLWYSYDDGQANWVFIDNVKVGDGMYFWDSAKTQAGTFRWPTSPAARWKIHLTANTNVWDMTDVRFGLRNSPFTYYLNDESQDNDVYTTAPGSDDNLGCYPAGPKLTLQALLETEDMEETDQIYVDTGTYYLTDTNHPILWEAADSGAENAPVTLTGSPQGSTFVTVGQMASAYMLKSEGNWINLCDVSFVGGGLELNGEHVSVSNVTVSNGYLNVYSEGATVSGGGVHRGSVLVSGKQNKLSGLAQRWGGMTVTGTNAVLENVSILYTNRMGTALVVRASGAAVSNCTVVSTRGTAVGKERVGLLSMGHNILVATGEGAAALAWLDGGLKSDWNDFVARDGAWVGTHDGKWERLSYWQKASGQDANSVSVEPLFQNEAEGDLHLNSKAGRWRSSDQRWVVDGEHSPAIDLGNPWVGTGREPMPNGYRRNLGAYGGTAEASKSVTNAWVTALTANDGGVVKGTNIVLSWAAGNAGGMTGTIEYSADGGKTWMTVAEGVDLMQTTAGGTYTWAKPPQTNSFDARWRITVDQTGASDMTDTSFNLRPKAQRFFVNDGSTEGDIYCGKAGNAAHTGRSTNSPLPTLKAVLDRYDLEGGDTVYVDTGTYTMTTNTTVIWSRSGDFGNPVRIVGNTNTMGASAIARKGSGDASVKPVGLDVKASNVEVSHLGFTGDEYTDAGVLLATNSGVTLKGLQFTGGLPYGVDAEANTNLAIRNSVFAGVQTGARVRYTKNVDFANLTFVTPGVAALQLASVPGDNVIENNIFIPGPYAQVYSIGGAESILADAEMDYNLYDFSETDGGQPNFYLGGPTDLRSWQLKMGNDFRSAITNAELADIVWDRDVHPKSAAGRYQNGAWVKDGTTSWAVDHGNPYLDVGDEAEPNANRLNIGAYGGTVQASKSMKTEAYDLRTLTDDRMTLYASDPLWPLVWSAELLGTNRDVLVWFSNKGEDKSGWIQLARTNALAEHYVWDVTDAKFLTGQGRWLLTDLNGNILAMSENDLTITRETLHISRAPYNAKGMMRFEWKGGLGGQHYWILYSDDSGKSWRMWDRKYNGPAKMHKSDFTLAEGEALSVFEDRTSYEQRMRWYTITTNNPTAHMTNGVYVP